MPMTLFMSKFKELGGLETRSVHVRGVPPLPNGEYAFIEFYCDDPKCDCRRVLFHVVRRDTKDQVWAAINYGWERPAHYRKWAGKAYERDMAGAALDPLHDQSEWAPTLLELCKSQLLSDAAYVRRLQRHYTLFKANDPERPLGLTPGLVANLPEWMRRRHEKGALRIEPGEAKTKISAVLLELVHPFITTGMSLRAFELLVKAGVVAWNLSRVSAKERGAALAEALENATEREAETCLGLMAVLTARKKERFPNDRRCIVSFNVLRRNGEYVVQAASSDDKATHSKRVR